MRRMCLLRGGNKNIFHVSQFEQYILIEQQQLSSRLDNFKFSKLAVGIEIPDYVSSPSKGNLLKTIQSR